MAKWMVALSFHWARASFRNKIGGGGLSLPPPPPPPNGGCAIAPFFPFEGCGKMLPSFFSPSDWPTEKTLQSYSTPAVSRLPIHGPQGAAVHVLALHWERSQSWQGAGPQCQSSMRLLFHLGWSHADRAVPVIMWVCGCMKEKCGPLGIKLRGHGGWSLTTLNNGISVFEASHEIWLLTLLKNQTIAYMPSLCCTYAADFRLIVQDICACAKFEFKTPR